MRLIDADELMELYENTPICNIDNLNVPIGVVRQNIKDMPTVDAVPVVRCKDCRCWENGDCYRLELSRPDDFCSYAERKKDDL